MLGRVTGQSLVHHGSTDVHVLAFGRSSACRVSRNVQRTLSKQALAAPCALRALPLRVPRGFSHGRSARFPVAAAAWFNQQGPEEQIAETVPLTDEDDKLETLKLDAKVRESVMQAAENLGGRVTVGDVSARAGVSVFQAEQCLQALAADAQGTLQVSTEGDVVYVLPRGFRGIITSRSFWLRTEPLFKKVAQVANYTARVAFGVALLTSIAVVWTAIVVALSSSNNDRDDRRSNRGGGFNVMIWPNDLFFFMDPYYGRRRRYYDRGIGTNQKGRTELNLFESIFSFVFGDGDPNVGWEEQRWQMLGRVIASKRGVVTAEEMAPYLDLPKGGAKRGDEGYVVPALLKFGGHPEVDEQGNLLYSFPDLQKSASASMRQGVVDKALYKAQWQLTKAEGQNKVWAIALGVFNLVGVTLLSSLLAAPVNRAQLVMSGFGGVVGVAFPLLQAYAAAYFVLPTIRWLQNKRKNAAIEESNASRREAVARLGVPPPDLARKLSSARDMGRAGPKLITEKDVVYRSDRDFADQQQQEPALDWEAQDFDRRLKYSSRDQTKDMTRG